MLYTYIYIVVKNQSVVRTRERGCSAPVTFLTTLPCGTQACRGENRGTHNTNNKGSGYKPLRGSLTALSLQGNASPLGPLHS